MRLYAGTSLLASYYINDANSLRAQALIHATADPLVFTGLHLLELRNALALGVYRQLLRPAQSQGAWVDLERDIRAGRLLPQPLNWVPVFRAAAQSVSQSKPSASSRMSSCTSGWRAARSAPLRQRYRAFESPALTAMSVADSNGH